MQYAQWMAEYLWSQGHESKADGTLKLKASGFELLTWISKAELSSDDFAYFRPKATGLAIKMTEEARERLKSDVEAGSTSPELAEMILKGEVHGASFYGEYDEETS